MSASARANKRFLGHAGLDRALVVPCAGWKEIFVFFGMVVVILVLLANYNPLLPHSICQSSKQELNFDSYEPIPSFKTREHLGNILEAEKLTHGAELGVQRGLFAKAILRRWPSCKKYMLVDLWAPQENYHDSANVDQARQNENYGITLANIQPFKDKIDICRDSTTACVKRLADGSLVFIYVDARHDFKGVYEDLVNWWPKLRKGGIMAGHDYVTQAEVGNQNWTLNYDGTVDLTGTVVKGAVDKFAVEIAKRQISVSYRENVWNSWAIRK